MTCVCAAVAVSFSGWNNVEAFTLLPQERGDFYVISHVRWPPFLCCYFSVQPPLIFTYYPSVILHDAVDASGLWPLAITEYRFLSIMPFLVVTRDGDIGFQCAGSRRLVKSPGMLVWLPVRSQAQINDYGLHHLIDRPASDQASGYEAFQYSALVEWTL